MLIKKAKMTVVNNITKQQYKTSGGFIAVRVPYPIVDEVCKAQYKAYSYQTSHEKLVIKSMLSAAGELINQSCPY